MAKRRIGDRTSGRYNREDNPIDIDGAFTPTKGKQSVDYDVDDERIGLTQAFGPITMDDEPQYGWDDNDKWKNFDWNASYEAEDEGSAGESDEPAPTDEQADSADGQPSQPEQAKDASTGSAPAGTTAAAAVGAAAGSATESTVAGKTPGKGRHAAPSHEDSPRMRKSRRMRRVLIALIILLVIGLAAIGFFAFRTVTETNEQAAQQTQEQAASVKEEHDTTPAADTATSTAKQADVPDLSAVMGMTQDEAIGTIKRGAQVVGPPQAVTEEGSAIKTNVTGALTSEPADSRTGGTPTVYLGLNEEGRVIQAGYSASASALGFGSLSFADAVSNERVIEKTLARIGVDVPEQTVVLPENKEAYSTFASDGTTVVKERCAFEGTATVKGAPCLWSAVLSYDYATQVLTGNLSDTVRVIYVYVTAA